MVEEKKQEPKKQKKPRRKRSFLRIMGSIIGWLFVIGLMGVLFAGGAVAGYVTSIVEDEPVRSRALIENTMNDNAITGFAYFRDGSPIGQLRTEEDRRPVESKEIPKLIRDAVISIEDNRFETHKGVDIKGTARAVKERVLNEPVQTGGSTLTQQLARLTFLSRDKTDNRKVKEMLLAMRMERFLSKEQILTAYLNKVPYGNGSSGYQLFGIKAAAKGIFNINNLNDLNIAQAAYLAGLPQLPSSYSAFNGQGQFNEEAFNRAINRQHRVLTAMLDEGKISQAEHDEAKAFDLKSSLAPRTQKAYVTYPYLMMEVERQASNILMQLSEEAEQGKQQAASELTEDSASQLSTGGYRVYTTIDRTVYRSMRSIAEDDSIFNPDSESKGKEQTAAMMIDNKTGAILGMIEGRDFKYEQMNYATQMKRQPGSAMKPIAAYLPAMDSGAIQPASVVDDAPIILKDYQKGFHIPKNSYSGYKGLMTAREALNRSTNTVALKLFNNNVGIESAWEFSKKLGITTLEEGDYNAATGVLGGLSHGVTVEELTNAYSAIGNQGKFADAFMIEKIVDSKGNIVYKHEIKPEQVFSEQTAYLMTDMLRTVITNGTGSTVRDRYNKMGDIPIVGKTGTTQNYGDVWFMGYSPDVTLGVWVGYKQMIHTLEGDQRKHAQSIWARIMNEITDVKPELFPTKTFEKPEGITSKTVSAYSGKIPTGLTDKFVTDIFNAKFVPTESDDASRKPSILLIEASIISHMNQRRWIC
ncbi:multimodular transpeptidase-transglycosylase [Paenibacillus sp. JCM 10914]|nr:multimodular transpeptidase-transglycosylase [Paenibacillus sp. JCM 10914]